MRRITILGSTGSIGKSTLNIISRHRDRFEVIALTAKTQIDELYSQCQEFNPKYAVVADDVAASQLQQRLQNEKNLKTEVLLGPKALEEVAALSEVDCVMAAIVGAAGLLPTLAAARAGKTILLANKEALVMSGALFMETINKHQATLLPIDSEHNAIFQCMPQNYVTGEKPEGVENIILTASGGPFRSMPLENFAAITPEQAIAHPNWKMGAKISVDSATMMNKGLEVIEAHWLFNLDISQIEVIIHPQSIIHSLVSYSDGSFLAQLGSPDMRTPIAFSLAWPDRIVAGVKKLNLLEVGHLSFEPIHFERFPCLNLAYFALKAGGTATAILNAANEVAVAAFLDKRLPFLKISSVVEQVLERVPTAKADSYEAILEADSVSRECAEKIINSSYHLLVKKAVVY